MNPAELSERVDHPEHETRRASVLVWLMAERELVRIHRGKGHVHYESLSQAIAALVDVGAEMEEQS